MPRSNTYLVEGYTYHLTHRCHNREHHLKRVRERDVYRKWLLEGVKRFDVCVYAFAITNNHVHVVAHTDDLESLAVGSLKFIEEIRNIYPQRKHLYSSEAGLLSSDAWCVKEESLS